ncbi:MAG: radical SAM protein [Candidatus Omnitrophica bacterium]|nr:radical SAM protein [Candidatus Omnitrophota bacterium]
MLKNLAFYISRKACYPLVAPDVLQLSITTSCNLRCKSCNVWKQPEDKKNTLTFSEMQHIIDEAACWGVKEVHLLGGEPLLMSEWGDIVAHAKSKGMFVVICTNGTLIDDTVAGRILSKKVDLLSISLDGAKAQTHDSLRGQDNAYDKILKGLAILNMFDNPEKPKVVLILTVSRKNLFELKEYIDLAKKFSVYGVYFTALVLDNVNLFSKIKTHDLWIEPKDFGNLNAYFQEVEKYASSKGYYLNYPSFKLFPKYFKGELQRGDWQCFAGLKRLVVTPAGDIQICGKTVGNYKKSKSIKKTWRSAEAFKRRRFVLKCTNYCLQDCHARSESSSFLEIAKEGLKIFSRHMQSYKTSNKR